MQWVGRRTGLGAAAPDEIRTAKRAFHHFSPAPDLTSPGSPNFLHQRQAKDQQARTRVLLEFGNPNRILSKELFDHLQRKIAALDVNHLWAVAPLGCPSSRSPRRP